MERLEIMSSHHITMRGSKINSRIAEMLFSTFDFDEVPKSSGEEGANLRFYSMLA